MNEITALPEWMKETENFSPPSSGNQFAYKTIRAVSRTMAGIRIQKGHEKSRVIPAPVKLIFLIMFLILIALTRSVIVVMAFAAAILGYLCTWPGKDIIPILKTSCFSVFVTILIFAPAMIINPEGIRNNLFVIAKVFLSVSMLTIFNHTTQWNHITGALRKFHIPGIFVFTLDISLKFIVLLGNLINDILTSLVLRSVGKNKKKYASLGGTMGTAMIRGSEMGHQMYEAMLCRGFTDDYKGL